jgi:two-component system CheB/CheR fusion protein
MKNLLDSTNIAVLFLDMEMQVRRFTPKMTEIIPLNATDSGRPINHFATSLKDVDVAEYGTKVLSDLVVRETKVKCQDDTIYLMKIRPYRTSNNVIDGVVVTFENTIRMRGSTEAT